MLRLLSVLGEDRVAPLPALLQLPLLSQPLRLLVLQLDVSSRSLRIPAVLLLAVARTALLLPCGIILVRLRLSLLPVILQISRGRRPPTRPISS
jgi:hypothetical protein